MLVDDQAMVVIMDHFKMKIALTRIPWPGYVKTIKKFTCALGAIIQVSFNGGQECQFSWRGQYVNDYAH